MGCFEGETAKRHCIWSNDYAFVKSIVASGGYLSVPAKAALSRRALATSTVDPITGKKSFTGVKKKLKASQSLACIDMVGCGIDFVRQTSNSNS